MLASLPGCVFVFCVGFMSVVLLVCLFCLREWLCVFALSWCGLLCAIVFVCLYCVIACLLVCLCVLCDWCVWLFVQRDCVVAGLLVVLVCATLVRCVCLVVCLIAC